MLSQRIGFVGAGQMARALARGFVDAGLVGGFQIAASDVLPTATDELVRTIPGAKAVKSNAEVAAQSDIIFLAVKPQHIQEVMDELHDALTGEHVVISIAAGMRLATLESGLGPKPRLVRVMPNTPCLVGQSASGYCLGKSALPGDGELVHQLLSSVGKAYQLDEHLLDAVTGLAGSGPAFVYVAIEALSDGGVRMGLPREVASALAAQTVKGAAEMVLTTGEHPAALKDRVASPGGTTIAGLSALESGGLRAALIAAVEAATRRSIELGSGSNDAEKKNNQSR